MSRIYFHSPSETREIYGRERAWMGCLTDDIAAGALGFGGFGGERYVKFLPPDAYPLRIVREKALGWGIELGRSLQSWARSGNAWLVNGEPYDCWQLALNTVLAIGNDPIKLCARLHAQCEIHCFVEGPNRAWLAGIIRDGCRAGIMRDDGYAGEDGRRYGERQWSDLAARLESRDDEPVVCSYSVCEQFPNRSVAEWEDDCDGDGWYDLPGEGRWRLAMDKAREHCPELKPDGWAGYRFGHEKDAFWLMSQAG